MCDDFKIEVIFLLKQVLDKSCKDPNPLRHRIEHLGLCTVEQIEQAAKLNLALSILWPTCTSTEKHTLNTFLDQSAQTAGHPSRRQPRLAFDGVFTRTTRPFQAPRFPLRISRRR